jgi:protein KRI1
LTFTVAVEDKFGKGSKKRAREEDDDGSEDESSSEDEDDVGVLATEALDQEIFATLAAIRNKDPRVYDGKTSFYAPIAETASTSAADGKKEKPMYLRDYHRENLLAGRAGQDDEPAVGEAKTFVQQQDELKRTVIKEMHTAVEADVSSDDEEDDEFLIRKIGTNEQEKGKAKQDPPNPSLADKDPEEFLNKFLTSRAWTQSSSAAYVPIESDDSEDDAAADAFEYSYNMRFEDPDATARAKLVSYGRDVVNANTVRREEKSQRKKAREEKRRRKEEEKSQRETEKGRLKKLKAGELMEKFKLVKEAADLNSGDDEAEAAVLSKLLEGDFSDGEWNRWMEERFGDKYYDKEGRPKKPEFEDDIDIGDIDSEFEDEAVEEEEGMDENTRHLDAFQEAPDEGGLGNEDQPKGKSRKELTKERQAQKAKERSTRRKVERFLEDNYDFDAEVSCMLPVYHLPSLTTL